MDFNVIMHKSAKRLRGNREVTSKSVMLGERQRWRLFSMSMMSLMT